MRSLSSAEATAFSRSALASTSGDDALDHLVLAERAADCLGQRARQHEVDRPRGLGRREHLDGRGLDAGARAVVAVRVAELTPARTTGSRIAVRVTARAGRSTNRVVATPNLPAPHDDADDGVRLPVGGALHSGSFTAPTRNPQARRQAAALRSLGARPAPASPAFGGSSPPTRARKTRYVQAW